MLSSAVSVSEALPEENPEGEVGATLLTLLPVCLQIAI